MKASPKNTKVSFYVELQGVEVEMQMRKGRGLYVSAQEECLRAVLNELVQQVRCSEEPTVRARRASDEVEAPKRIEWSFQRQSYALTYEKDGEWKTRSCERVPTVTSSGDVMSKDDYVQAKAHALKMAEALWDNLDCSGAPRFNTSPELMLEDEPEDWSPRRRKASRR